MLILTRKIGESLMIGDKITVTVLAVKGNLVREGAAGGVVMRTPIFKA